MDWGAAFCLYSQKAATPQPPLLAVPSGAGLGPAGGRQGWPAAGVGRLRPALARPVPGGHQRAQGGRGWADAVG